MMDARGWRPSLATKLRLTAWLSLLTVSLVCGGAVLGTRRYADAAQNAFDDGFEILRVAASLDIALQRARDIVLTAKPNAPASNAPASNALRAEFAGNVSGLQDMVGRVAARPFLSTIAMAQHAAVIAAIVRLERIGMVILEQGRSPDRRTVFETEADGLADKLRTWRMLMLDTTVTMEQASRARARTVLLWTGLFCVAAWGAGVVALTVIGGALRRFGRITIAMLRLARHDRVLSLPSLDDPDEVGDMARAIAIFRETAEEATRRGAQLEIANRMLDAALNSMGQGLLMLDSQQRLLISNRQYRALFGLPSELLHAGMPAQELLALSRAAGNFANRDPTAVERHITDWLASDRPQIEQITVGNGRVVIINRVPMADGGWVCTYDDVTERNRTIARVAHLARHDVLTDLPNRRALLDALRQEDNLGSRRHGYTVHCINLDRFKLINDTLGYAVGDAILCEVARRLRAIVRENDLPARLGSDDFAVVQSDGDTPDKAIALAARLVSQLSLPYVIDGAEVLIGASVGVAAAGPDGDADGLLRNADLALYHAKQAGGGGWQIFAPEMDVAAQSRRTLERDLRLALPNGQFELYYQPLISVTQRRVKSFEALLRWRHPTRGLIAPDAFIPLAEELGLIVPIGEWVLRTACAEAMEWPEPVSVAVNLSPVQFGQRTATGDIAEQIEAALRDTGLTADRLELEITESVLLQESDSNVAALHRLRALGVRISLDDFGTGYSSLRYLRSFPFDKLKIDKSFVRELTESDEAGTIVRAIAGLGASLGIATTAEGVETLQQLEQLIADGCTEVQGYFFSPPRPAGEVPRLLAEGAMRRAA